MILADKIIQLRKKNGWSQEELAEHMNVSRQAVSKWESAQAVPDLQKILVLAELFGVTTDYLLKDDIEDEQYTSEESSDKKKLSLTKAHEYITLRRKSAFMIASATFLCIVSVIPLIILAGASECLSLGITENQACAWGLTVLFLFVTAAVGIYIFCGFKSSEFDFLTKEDFDTEYGVDGLSKDVEKTFSPTYAKLNLIATMLCIISPLPLIISAFFANGFVLTVMVGLLLFVVAVGVFLFIYAGVRWASLRRLQKDPEYAEKVRSGTTQRKISLIDTVSTVFWLTVTAIYLLCSFITAEWNITWIIWVIAGILYAAINAIVSYLESRKKS